MPSNPELPADLDAWIAEVRKRCDAATEGPWFDWFAAPNYDFSSKPEDCVLGECHDYNGENNRQFIIHARTNLPQALDIIADLRRENEKLKDDFQKTAEAWGAASDERDRNKTEIADLRRRLAESEKERDELKVELSEAEKNHADEIRSVEHAAKEAGFEAGKRGGWY